jgi:hypothetical protein
VRAHIESFCALKDIYGSTSTHRANTVLAVPVRSLEGIDVGGRATTVMTYLARKLRAPRSLAQDPGADGLRSSRRCISNPLFNLMYRKFRDRLQDFLWLLNRYPPYH